MRAVAAAAMIAVALTACSGGADKDDNAAVDVDLGDVAEAQADARPCAEAFTPGRPVADVLAEGDDPGVCTGESTDDLIIMGFASWDCPDGTTVHQAPTGYGWGLDGQTWQGPDVPEPYADCVLPGTDAQHP